MATKKRRVTRKKTPIKRKSPVKKAIAKKRAIKRAINPGADHYIKVITKKNATGYFAGTSKSGAKFDTSILRAKRLSSSVAELVADLLREQFKRAVKEIRVVKKTEAGTGRKDNPIPASKLLKAKNAVNLYEDFTGHKADHYVNVRVDWPDVGLLVGKCDGILYSTVRDGMPEKYIHRFKNSARPELVASHDGAMIALIGGKFRFTNRGIVDH